MSDGGGGEDGLVQTRSEQMAGVEERVDGVEVKEPSHVLVHSLEHFLAHSFCDGILCRRRGTGVYRRARHVDNHTAVDLGPGGDAILLLE